MTLHNSSNYIASVRINTFDSPPGSSPSGNKVGWHDMSSPPIDVRVPAPDITGTSTGKAVSLESVPPFIWSGSSTTRVKLEPNSTTEVFLLVTTFAPGTYDLSNYTVSWNLQESNDAQEKEGTCQGKHVKLPFYSYEFSVQSVFEIIHSDLWTSPISSESDAIFLDHFLHFVWVYHLHKKSDLFDTFVAFRAYVNKQFNVDIKALQCDHGGEYDNTRFHDLFRQNGIQFQFSCPRTSQHNGKSERMLRTINNLIRTLLFQAHIPPSYWVEALNMAAHLLNILPSTAIKNEIPFTKLYNQTPTYEHLCVLDVFAILTWLRIHKFHAGGSLSRYKSRLVANGRSQQQGIDYDEGFSLVIALLHGELAMTDQSTYVEEIIEHAHVQKCNPCRNPVDTESKLGADGDPVSDPTLYRSLAGLLQYLTFTRSDISYAVQHVCLYMHDPRKPHLAALNRILRYVCGTIDHGLQLHVSSTS
ncbi:ribonuclease H-like domain-containing protein [Tanacetum coccineum]